MEEDSVNFAETDKGTIYDRSWWVATESRESQWLLNILRVTDLDFDILTISSVGNVRSL